MLLNGWITLGPRGGPGQYPNTAPLFTFYGRAIDEFLQFYALGVDGLFTDNTDTAVEARKEFLAAPRGLWL